MDQTFIRNFELSPRLFSNQSAWNQFADTVETLDHNDKYVATTYDIFHAAKVRPCISMLYEEYTFPIFAVKTEGGPLIQDIEICSYEGHRWNPLTIPWYETADKRMFARGVPLPKGKIRPSGPKRPKSDGALILYNPETNEEYDFWQATTDVDCRGVSKGGGLPGKAILMAGHVSWFRVDEHAPGCQLPICDARAPGTLPRGSCRATGVPYLAGLLVPENLATGMIQHALTFTLPKLRHIPNATRCDPPDYVYPATRTETADFTQDPFALAAGMRIRLKSQVFDERGSVIDESPTNEKLAKVTRLFFRALREYGAYLVDGGRGFGFAAEDYHTAWLDLPDEDVADLIGQSSIDGQLGDGKTKWRIVMDKLNAQLTGEDGPEDKGIPFATKLADGTLLSNFDVVENACSPDVNWQRGVTSPRG